MSNKFLNETFTTQESYVNLSQHGPKIIKELLTPLRTIIGKNKDYDGQAKMQYYIKFSNESTLKVFLSYLCNKQFPFSKKVNSEQDSIQLIIEKLNHLKDYYKTNKKDLQVVDQSSLNEVIKGIENKYLYLDNVTHQNYTQQEIDDQSQSSIALAVLRYNKNIILAILKRTPAEIIKRKQKPIQVSSQSKNLNFEVLFTKLLKLVAIILLVFFVYSIYKLAQSSISEGRITKIQGFLHLLGLVE